MRRIVLLVSLLLCLGLVLPTSAAAETPEVTVNDQVSLNGTVMIDSVYSEGPGWVVIHVDNNGKPGRVAGEASVAAGWTYQLEVPIDTTIATPVLYAMLHVDDGQIGVYEFDGQSGLDNPVMVNGQMVTPAFNVSILRAYDQFIQNDTFTAASVTLQQDGWLVIHSDANGKPGPVLGHERVLAGTTKNVQVTLDANGRTEVLWPMLHIDTGTAGVYEFGTVAGADPPVVTRGVMAVTPIWTVPHVRVADQIVVHGDNQGAPNTTLAVESVLAEVPGWLVIHSDGGGKPGPVVGFIGVPAGLSTNLTVNGLNPNKVTPVLWPMLHVDDHSIGDYEFGTVSGADAPVMVDGKVLTFPINAAPSLVLHNQDPLPGETEGSVRFVVDEALIDAQGWLVIHSNADGKPGPVLTHVQLHAGLNKNVIIEVDQAKAGDQVFPMLHYDTGTVGQYEFGTVPNADPPVMVGGTVIVSPQYLTAAGPSATPQATTEATAPANTSASPGLHGHVLGAPQPPQRAGHQLRGRRAVYAQPERACHRQGQRR